MVLEAVLGQKLTRASLQSSATILKSVTGHVWHLPASWPTPSHTGTTTECLMSVSKWYWHFCTIVALRDEKLNRVVGVILSISNSLHSPPPHCVSDKPCTRSIKGQYNYCTEREQLHLSYTVVCSDIRSTQRAWLRTRGWGWGRRANRTLTAAVRTVSKPNFLQCQCQCQWQWHWLVGLVPPAVQFIYFMHLRISLY